MTIVEPPFDHFEEQGKHLLVESAVGVEPVFGIAPEAFDAVDVGSTLRNSNLFGHGDVRPTQTKTGVSPVFVCVVQTADGGVGVDNGQQLGSASRRDRECSNMPIPLLDAEYDGFSLGSPAPGTRPESNERSFVEFELPIQTFGPGKQVLVDARAAESIESLYRLLIDLDMEAEPVRGNAQTEVFEQSGFGLPGESAGLPPNAGWFEPITTCGALGITSRKRPEFSVRTLGAVLNSHNPLADITIPGYQLQA